jgi:uncharacterized protein (DUF2236 family)
MLNAVRDLIRPLPGMSFDFSQPAGEPALAPASVDGDCCPEFPSPVTLFVGGLAAVLLEFAEPSLRFGVLNRSSFQRDRRTPLQGTGVAAMMAVAGPRSDADKLIAHLVRMYSPVEGTTPHGIPYHANHPRLLDWVQVMTPEPVHSLPQLRRRGSSLGRRGSCARHSPVGSVVATGRNPACACC